MLRVITGELRMRHFLLAFFFIAVCGSVQAADQPDYVVLGVPYLELHTGPDSVYPVTQVVERGGEFSLLKRRTGWYKVRTSRGYEGWVSADELEAAIQADDK